ncbi:hypothetical protein [Romboutsia sp.]|uniref:hypothetical protein n=1 Tax=Romboutsia sp. TaxID=1965302 RepID=UPI003F2EF650
MEKILAILVYIGEVGIYLAPIIYIVKIYFKKRAMEAKKLLDMQNALYYISNLEGENNIENHDASEETVSDCEECE